MLAEPSDPHEVFRRAEFRLRVLLLGDGSIPGVVRGGEETRLRVQAELRRMRQAMDQLAAARDEPAAAPREPGPTLVTPAEAAGELGVSVSSVYRAVRSGELRSVRLAARKRGAIRIPASEVRRLAGEPTRRHG